MKVNGKLYNVKEEVNSGLGDLFIEVDMLVYSMSRLQTREIIELAAYLGR